MAKVEECTVTYRLLVVDDYVQVSYMMPGKYKKQNVSIIEKEKCASITKTAGQSGWQGLRTVIISSPNHLN